MIFINMTWNSKPRTCYDPDGVRLFEVNDLRRLIKEYDEVYLGGSLFPNAIPQLRALIDNGANSSYFNRSWTWKRWCNKYADALRSVLKKRLLRNSEGLQSICDAVNADGGGRIKALMRPVVDILGLPS